MLDAYTAQDLALFAGLVWDDDRATLAPLIDAVTVWADEELLDELARPIVAQLWEDGLRAVIESALRDYGKAPRAALADLELGPARSRLALAYVKQGAVDLCPMFERHRCLCCVDDGLAVIPPERHEALVHETALELVLASDGDVDPEARIRQLALLAERSLPRLAAALLEVDFAALERDVVLARC